MKELRISTENATDERTAVVLCRCGYPIMVNLLQLRRWTKRIEECEACKTPYLMVSVDQL